MSLPCDGDSGYRKLNIFVNMREIGKTHYRNCKLMSRKENT